MSEITDLARHWQDEAGQVSNRHQKEASRALYRVLAGCMELCERCNRDPGEKAELHGLFLQQESSGNRRYVEHGSDIYILVCRFVFDREENRGNTNRYAHCLREAAKRQIASAGLYNQLANHGGVNALYLARPLSRTTVDTRCLRLTESITCPKAGRFTLTLERMPDNTYRPWAAEVLGDAHGQA